GGRGGGGVGVRGGGGGGGGGAGGGGGGGWGGGGWGRGGRGGRGWGWAGSGREASVSGSGPIGVALAAVEHSAVREASEREARRCATESDPAGLTTQEWLTTLDVDVTGRIQPESVHAALARPDLALVHCQWANQEVGTLQPVEEIVAACRQRAVTIHVDAAAAAGHVPIGFDDLGADLMSVSAHKLGGPRGMGALLVRRGLRVPPLLLGGAQ